MQRLDFYFATYNRYSAPITDHSFLLRCMPQDLPEQRISDLHLTILPKPLGDSPGKDSFGNVTYEGRLPEGHDHLRYVVRGTAIRDDTMRTCCKPMDCYRYPSGLTQPSPALAELAATVPNDGTPLEQAWGMAMAAHESICYTPNVTNVHTTADQALRQGHGVCQDYTNVFLALCRIRRLNVRYVSGIPLGEGPRHAWGEVWQEGFWYGIDPTRACRADETYIKLCCGRDFADCPIEVGVFRGLNSQEQRVYSRVSLSDVK